MKKLLVILLTLALVLGLFACGGGGTEPTDPSLFGNVTEEQLREVIGGEFTTPKNVIILIGDGMGPNDITLARQHGMGVCDFGLALDLIENHGLATTHSNSSEITDSAASGTALSTGFKTNNGYIGKDPDGNDLQTMAELAREQGKKVGIITDEDICSATPSAFVAHNISRDNRAELASAIIKFRPDVLMSADHDGTYALLDAEGKGIFNNEYLVAKDFRRFESTLAKDPGGEKPFWGFLNGYSSVTSDNLAQSTKIALDRLQNENGFFLMIESAGTDKFGHRGDMTGKLNSVVTLDRTVVAILQFMKENPDTLLIITSDHETGGVQLPVTGKESLNDLLTVTEHTATPVRVFGVGAGTEYFSGKTVDNTDIAKFLIAAIKGE